MTRIYTPNGYVVTINYNGSLTAQEVREAAPERLCTWALGHCRDYSITDPAGRVIEEGIGYVGTIPEILAHCESIENMERIA